MVKWKEPKTQEEMNEKLRGLKKDERFYRQEMLRNKSEQDGVVRVMFPCS